jgi:hypothetical protein
VVISLLETLCSYLREAFRKTKGASGLLWQGGRNSVQTV